MSSQQSHRAAWQLEARSWRETGQELLLNDYLNFFRSGFLFLFVFVSSGICSNSIIKGTELYTEKQYEKKRIYQCIIVLKHDNVIRPEPLDYTL